MIDFDMHTLIPTGWLLTIYTRNNGIFQEMYAWALILSATHLFMITDGSRLCALHASHYLGFIHT